MSLLRILPITIFLFISVFCGCASYKYDVRSAHLSFERGDFDRALQILEEKSKGNESEALLFLLDKGTVAHTAGRYEESNKFFEKAEDLANQLDAISISGEAATVMVDERLLYYKGEDFEKLLINDIKALNYFMLAEKKPKERKFLRNEALVECRRAQLRLEQLFKKGVKHFEIDPLAIYLCGLAYELQGEFNDAYISYRHLYELNNDAPYVKYHLLTLSRRLGFHQEFASWSNQFKGSIDAAVYEIWQNPAGRGELVLLIENGYAPEKIPNPNFPQIPTYLTRPKSANGFEILVDRERVTESQLLSNLQETALAYMKKKGTYLIAKRVAGIVAKEVIAYEVAKESESKAAGWATRILLHSLTRADLRSWLTYPADFSIARIYLKPGFHEVTFLPTLDGTRQHDLQQMMEKVEIRPNQKTILVWRLLR